jgi:NAD+ synthase
MSMLEMAFSKEVLHLDAARVAADIERAVRAQVFDVLRRRGVIVGLSGGIDSSVVTGLCVRALGPDRVTVLLMPDRDSSADSLRLGRLLARQLGVEIVEEDITAALTALGCYTRQDQAIRTVFPESDAGCKWKITVPPILDRGRISVSQLTILAEPGVEKTARIPPEAYRQIVAATNFKQRVRKVIEYYHADRRHYAVAGTPNRLEYDQGFFVKQGDGAADLKPIAHLYKTQVFALAEYLGLPPEIRQRQPTTDTFSLPQSQEEFYFALPYEAMDLCLYGRNHGVPAGDVAAALGLTPRQVEYVYSDIDQKRRTTAYLHRRPLLVDAVTEVGG